MLIISQKDWNTSDLQGLATHLETITSMVTRRGTSGKAVPVVFLPHASSRLLKNDLERSSRQFCFRMSHFPILFFRGRPSIDSFVSRGGLSAEFFSSLLEENPFPLPRI